MDNITYTKGPRILADGTNLDQDIVASFPVETEVSIAAPVTNLMGVGYEPGQQNLDGSDL